MAFSSRPDSVPEITTPQDYQTFLESFAQAIWETDSLGQIISDSPGWRAYVGQSLNEWLSLGWTGAVHPGERSYTEHQWQKSIARQQPFDAELCLTRPGGGWQRAVVKASPLFNADGSVKKWLGAVIGIHEKKQEDQCIRHAGQPQPGQQESGFMTGPELNQRLVQATLDSSLDVIQVFSAVRDEAGRIVDFVWLINNRKAVEQNGDVIGKSLLKQNPGVVPTGIFDHMVRVTQTGLPYEGEQYYEHEQFSGWFYQALVKSDDGVAMTTRNITKEKQAQLALQQSEFNLGEKIAELEKNNALLRSTEEVAHTGSYEADLLQDKFHFSEGMYRLFGEAPGAIIPSLAWIDSRSYPDDIEQVRNILNQAIASKQPYFYHRRIYHKDGDLRTLEAHGRVICDQTGTAVKLIGLVQDITERQQAQQQLTEAKDLLQTILDSSPNAITAYKPVYKNTKLDDFRIVFVNAFTEKTAGINPMGQLLTQTFPTARLNGLFDQLKIVLEHGQSLDFELWYEGEGMHHWFRVIAVPMKGMVLVTIEDVTSRKQSEQQLKASKDLVQTVFDVSLNPIAFHKAVRNAAGNIVDFEFQLENRKARKYAMEDRRGQRFSEAYPGIENSLVFKLYCDVVETGNELNTEVQLNLKGTDRWFHLMAVKLDDGLVATALDVTERKKAEEEILRLKEEVARKATDKFQLIFNSIAEGFCILELLYDEEGKAIDFRFAEVNPAFEHQTGLKNVSGKTFRTVTAAEPQWMETYDRVVKTGECTHFEDYHKGTGRWYQVNASRIGNSPALAVVFQNITERKQRESSLAFLTSLMSDFAPLSSVDEIMDMAARRITEHLNLSHCTFVRIDPEAWQFTILYDSRPAGLPGMTGTYNLADFHTEEEYRLLASGRSMIVNDVDDGTRSASQVAAFEAINVRSLINTPYLHNGRWVFDLGVTRSTPGIWHPYEVDLLKEVSSRVWLRLERAQAEEALRKSEAKFRRLSDSGLVAVAFFDIYGAIVEANDAFLTMLGVDREELNSQKVRWNVYTPEEWLPRTWQAIDEFRKTGTIKPYEKQFYHSSGALRWGIFAGATLEDDRMGVSLVIDITDRKRAEEALRKSEEHTRLAMEAVDMATWEWSLLNDQVFWNEQHFRLLGMPVQTEPLYTDAFLSRLHPEDQQWVKAELVRAIEEQGLFDAEFRIVRDDGVIRWMSGYGRITAQQVGKPTQMSGVMFDINDRKEVEVALKRSQERLQKAISIETVGMIFFDLHGIIHDANTAFEQISGISCDDLVSGKVQWDELTPPEFLEVSLNAMNELITTGKSAPYEKEYIRPDGSRWWGQFAGKRLSENEIVEFVIDITASKKAQQALQEADRRKDEFLAMLAHELRNPMSTIRTGLNILALSTPNEITGSTLVMMNRQTDHLVRMVDDLLDVSRITRGKIELRKERVDLVEIVRQAVEHMQPVFLQHGKTLHVDLPAAVIGMDGDPTRLNQVVTNLLTNGVRYTGEKGEVWISLQNNDREAILQVRDNGIGLASDQLSAIFGMFVQVDNSLARSRGGLGMGLTLVQRLVQMHDGEVQAQSEGTGKGSTFIVRLPTWSRSV
ncbi:PAS domain S-box protein [Dyadobacter flavalbus]|uniref:histidine kinase n=1 Tax=Dyadobacter flavalbus TaxID=2579942 RepID=A0A5M8QDA8_9BACT|nr:PAS domain S-box protein [Dyadobacter flavalbus]KAA6432736.1 PAS domain S-box protein [Dyadobacter flavalbus]